MKIALLTHSVNPRGGVVHTLELGEALHKAGHEVTVMAPAINDQDFFRGTRCKVELIRIENRLDTDLEDMVERRLNAYVLHITNLLRVESFDIFHAHDGIGGNALIELKRLRLINHFVRTVHHLDDFVQPRLKHWQEASVLRAEKVLCVSNLWRGKLAEQFGIDAQLVNNGVDPERFKTVDEDLLQEVKAYFRLDFEGPIVLAMGGIEKRKNTLLLLEAFNIFRAQHPNAKLVIAGGATLLDHSEYVKIFNHRLTELGLNSEHLNTVIVTGPVDDSFVPALYQLASVVAVPSVKEGFGLVTLESLCSGTPIVVSQIEPFTEYLTSSDCYWIDPKDPKSIANGLTLATKQVDSQRVSASAKKLAQTYSWKKSAATHVAIYKQILLNESITCP
jgi:glycosyltransferase-like protein